MGTLEKTFSEEINNRMIGAKTFSRMALSMAIENAK
jgi:hypothetical protein